MSYIIITIKFLYVCLKIEFKAKIKYLKFDLYGIIIVTSDTIIYMKPNQQNQFIFFFPIFDIGGVEKNFLILSNFFEKKLKNFECLLITYNKNSLLQKNLNKSIKLITPNLNFGFLFRRMKFLFCMLVLFIRCVKYPKCIIFSFQGNFYALLVAWILNKKIVIRSNLAPDAWSSNFVKKKLFKFLLSKSNLIIVNSLDFKKKIKKYYNLKSIKIYNPINLYNRNYFNNYKSKDNFFKKNYKSFKYRAFC